VGAGTVAEEALPGPPLVVAGAVVDVPPRAEPARFGFAVEPVFMLAAPGGRLLEDCGCADPAFGLGGDWVAPACAKAGLAARSRAKAAAYFIMFRRLQGLSLAIERGLRHKVAVS
jgi:hypothetical protein